jgi:bifunctional NMN adenylyltransferase/nudix hydrolase
MPHHPFDAAIVIGRFQPFHIGHLAIIENAFLQAPEVVIVLGSSHQARSAKNPFSNEERKEMILGAFSAEQQKKIEFAEVRDHYDDIAWANEVKHQITQKKPTHTRIALVGFIKDHSSYYLELFPHWHLVELAQTIQASQTIQAPQTTEKAQAKQQNSIHATHLRKVYFESPEPLIEIAKQVPASTATFLKNWQHSQYFSMMQAEHHTVEENKKTWGIGPFITTDAIVISHQHILLVKRKHHPGKNLWAIPGGFLDLQECILDCAIRELKEETQIDIEKIQLLNNLKKVVVFDHPNRSARARIITHAHYFELPTDIHLPPVCAADDASFAQWIPIEQLSALERQLFEDHFHILQFFLSHS